MTHSSPMNFRRCCLRPSQSSFTPRKLRLLRAWRLAENPWAVSVSFVLRKFCSTLTLLTFCLLVSCAKQSEPSFPGYVEGEYVRVAAPLAGQITKLHVTRGQSVAQGEALFILEQQQDLAAEQEASARLHRAEAQLANLEKGQRPDEIAALEARLQQAQSQQQLAQAQFNRNQSLAKRAWVSKDQFDTTQTALQQAKARVNELTATLKTAKLGARSDEITAARAEVAALQATLAQVQWRLQQKSVLAPVSGLVTDTLYLMGEWAPAGTAVVTLLPKEHIKVRFFVAHDALAQFTIGQSVQFHYGTDEPPVQAHVSYISPQAEFTPPVLYSKQNRAKLVYMLEAKPDNPAPLHPGQPVDVALISSASGKQSVAHPTSNVQP